MIYKISDIALKAVVVFLLFWIVLKFDKAASASRMLTLWHDNIHEVHKYMQSSVAYVDSISAYISRWEQNRVDQESREKRKQARKRRR
jgi:hypothetical protein